jgi:peptide/nickel transport system substrate-binding protein/oligopeptide transport system substrate-binding protein
VQHDLSDRFGAGQLGLAAALAVAALASACNTSEAVSREPEAASIRAPHRGGVFRLVVEAPHYIDPVAVDSVYDALPVGQIFDGLVALDPGLNIIPALADTWTISRDGRVYTIHLREGVRFHDGTPLTSADVVFSLKRLLDPARQRKSIGVSYLQVVDGAPAYSAGRSRVLTGVTAIDANRVEIRLTRPYLSFLEVLSMDDLRIVPEKAVTAMGDDAFHHAPIGTGPFRFASWTDTELTLQANPDYFGGAPYLDRVVILFPGPDEHDAGNARFSRGETEMVTPTSETLPRLLADPRVEVHRFQDLSLSFLGLNTGIPPLDDVRVRRAIAYAIDRKALAAVAPSTRREAQGILPPGLPSYSPAPKALPYDPEAGRRLLAEAGHPGGRGLRPIRFFTAQSDSSAIVKSIEQLRVNLAAIGITLEVHKVTWRELIARIEEHAAPAFQLGWVADLPDPDSFLRTLFEPGGSANYFDFLDKETGSSLERGASETNPLERARIYREIEKTVLDKAPLVPLFHSMGMIASRRTVHGLKSGPMGIGALALEHVWIDDSGSAR